jgi:hypothetical protein
MKPSKSLAIVGLILLIGPFAWSLQSFADTCFICKKEIRFTIYYQTDEVAREKVFLCGDCTELPRDCYLCSLPVLRDFTELSDGRVLCRRDAKSAILDEATAVKICDQVKHDLDRQFIRFLTFPETNITLQLMDRIKLQELFKVIGKDFTCPNALGCTETKTNAGHVVYAISILSGLPQEDVMTTCVHEYTHAWIFENVPAARKKTLGTDAVEGFCELLAYLFAEQRGLSRGQSNILANHYTRGQIHLFIAAHQQYGLQDIVDWMIAGDDPEMLRSDLGRVRRLAEPAATNLVSKTGFQTRFNVMTNAVPLKFPSRLLLQGITWSQTRPMATINGRNFGVNEELKLLLETGPLTVRCLEIQPNAVVLQTNGDAARLVLEMK